MAYNWFEAMEPRASLHGISREQALAALARWHFTESAETLRSHPDANGWNALCALAYQGLAKNQFPIELAYATPSLALRNVSPDFLRAGGLKSRGDSGFQNPIKLCQALRDMGPLPVDEHKIRLLSGWELYERVVNCQRAGVHYYVKAADNRIINQNISAYSEAMDGANVVEICIGTGKQSAAHYTQVIAAGVKPKCFYLNDIVGEVLADAVREVGTVGILPEQIKCIPGDIHSEKFWQQGIWKQLRNDKAPTVVIFHGATFNDFSIKEMKQLLERFNTHFKAGTSSFISIDSTRDKKTLKSAYDYYEVYQWLVTGFAFGLKAIDFNVNPLALGCRVDIEAQKDFTLVKPVITNAVDQPYGDYILQAGDIPCHPLIKIKEEGVRKMMKGAGHEVVNILPFKGPHPHVRHNIWHVRSSGRPSRFDA